MFLRRQAHRLDVEVTARGMTVAWECVPGIFVRRSFTSASAGCAAVETLRRRNPGTIREAVRILDEVALEHQAPHPAMTGGPSARIERSHLHRRT